MGLCLLCHVRGSCGRRQSKQPEQPDASPIQEGASHIVVLGVPIGCFDYTGSKFPHEELLLVASEARVRVERAPFFQRGIELLQEREVSVGLPVVGTRELNETGAEGRPSLFCAFIRASAVPATRAKKCSAFRLGIEKLVNSGSRRFEDFQNQDNLQDGRLLRLQAQINF